MADIEKNAVGYADTKRPGSNGSPTPAYMGTANEPSYETSSEIKQGYGRRMWDSFKRDPNASIPKGPVGHGPPISEGHIADGSVFEAEAVGGADTGLARKLKGRHLQMIAIGGSIGKDFTRTSRL